MDHFSSSFDYRPNDLSCSAPTPRVAVRKRIFCENTSSPSKSNDCAGRAKTPSLLFCSRKKRKKKADRKWNAVDLECREKLRSAESVISTKRTDSFRSSTDTIGFFPFSFSPHKRLSLSLYSIPHMSRAKTHQGFSAPGFLIIETGE